MSISEIENAIQQLPLDQFAQLATWFDEYRERQWDEQIAGDVRAGRFEAVIQRAREQFQAGQCKTL